MSQWVKRDQRLISDDGFLKRIEETITVKRKSCPFCGGNAGTIERDDEEMNTYYRQRCQKCKAQTAEYSTLEQSVDAWNQRA